MIERTVDRIVDYLIQGHLLSYQEILTVKPLFGHTRNFEFQTTPKYTNFNVKCTPI